MADRQKASSSGAAARSSKRAPSGIGKEKGSQRPRQVQTRKQAKDAEQAQNALQERINHFSERVEEAERSLANSDGAEKDRKEQEYKSLMDQLKQSNDELDQMDVDEESQTTLQGSTGLDGEANQGTTNELHTTKKKDREGSPPDSAQTRADDDTLPESDDDANQDDDDQILESFKTLSVHGHTDGIADAWFRERKAMKLIVRYGPKKAAKYVVQQNKAYSTAGLQQVSDNESRLSSVMVRDGMGIKSRRYGLEHIVGIVGVAIVERTLNVQPSKAPTTYVKIKWTGISEHDRHLCKDGNNWSTRSDLISMVGQELAESKIKSAWEKQEAKYNNWEKGQGRDTPDRSPTPFPLDTFEKTQNPKRERSTPLRKRTNGSEKRDGTPPVPMDSTTDPEPNTVDGQAQNGVTQSESAQNNQFQNNQAQNSQAQNETQSNEAQKNDDKPTHMSQFYKKWLGRNNIDETTELDTLDDELFARFEVAARLYAEESEKNKLSFVDDLNILER